jgi:hypothetical protein
LTCLEGYIDGVAGQIAQLADSFITGVEAAIII